MANDILIIPASASIEFSGSAANTIKLQVEDSGSVSFYGNSGSLFGISDNLDGSLMSVNDISGLPTLETFSDGKLIVSPYAFQTRSMGFGTDTPIGNFDFVNPLAENVDFYIRTTQGSSYDTALHIRGSRTTSTTDELANIRFETADTSAGGVEMARISAIKDVSSTNIARLEFKTTSTDGASPTTKMMISASGNVGIGTTSPAYTLDVNGDVRADTYYYDVTSTLQSSSDKRLKTSITPLSSHTEKLLELNPVDFEWSEEKDNQPSRRERKKLRGVKDRGLIAQEVQEIYPELISEDADGYLTVSYTGLIIPMLKTIQEQQKQIDELKKLISGE